LPVRCLWLLSLVVISCDITSLVVPAGPVPSPVPGAVDTIVARTAAAASTQTAAKVTLVPTGTASATPPPSETPTPTPSPSPTFVFVLPTLTPTKKPTATSESSTAGFGCQLLSQSPPDGAKFAAKENFKVTWKIKNTGLAKWDAGTVDFAYFSGTKMFTGAQFYDLPKDVGIDGSITLSVPMAAPRNSGSFKTVWALKRGKSDFCHVDLQIVVP
jgi:hypothetical protein